jgi:hypothetical protein
MTKPTVDLLADLRAARDHHAQETERLTRAIEALEGKPAARTGGMLRVSCDAWFEIKSADLSLPHAALTSLANGAITHEAN